MIRYGDHGTVKRYRQYKPGEQRCEPCRAAYGAYNHEQYIAKNRAQRHKRVPTAKVRRHIQALMASGMSAQRIATAAGMQPGTIKAIAAGKPDLRLASAIAILAVSEPDPFAVPVIGVRRRVQALRRIGWTDHHIAQQSGVALGVVKELSGARSSKTRADIAAAIDGAYRAMCLTPGPSRASVTRATKRGWAPPLAWDDIDQDDAPTGLVLATTREAKRERQIEDPVIVERIIAGDYDGPLGHALSPDMRAAVIRHFSRVGQSDRQIGDRLGVTAHTIALHRKQYGIPTGWAA